MRTHHDASRAWIAAATILSLVISPSAPSFAALAQAPAQPPSEAETVDGGWPRAYVTPTASKVLVYQPQIASWADQKHMVAFAAVSYETQGASKPEIGSIKVEADTQVAMDDRLVRFASLTITEANFPTLAKEQTSEAVREIEKGFPDDVRMIALDRILANIDKTQIVPKNVEGVKADPPVIFFSEKPAVLVGFDGDPVWSPIKENDLKFAINTNWDVFEHGPSATFYVRNEENWFQAADLNGPWKPAEKLPESFKKLPADNPNWKEVRAHVPGKKISASKMPTVFVSQKPAELILLEGGPKYQAVTGTSLQWVSNTESDLFRAGTTGPLYYLVAGRWFSAADFTGPWTFATPSLPEDFKKIPLEHPRSRVLASVPGSDEAIEAVLLAQVPQTARVNKKELKAPEVAYQGDPQFQKIDGTSVERAVNTDKDIIKVGDLYYMCFQAVWFMSKSPEGPWEVTTSVPKSIYEIPASSASHHVTYVTVVEDDDDDDWATFAFVAGYTGLMVAWGCTVWGSGWYYPPYVGYGGFYPIYYPYMPTYGFGAWYNPWTGSYGRGTAVYGPYGGAGYAAAYNPRTGTYARGAAAYGPYGSRAAGQAWNPRTGTYAATRQGSNVYGSWGSTAVQRGDDWAQTARVTNRATGNTTRVTRTDEGAAVSRRGSQGGGVVAGSEGNVYAGRDGNVYRNEGEGWQKYDGGSWNSVEVPEGASERASQARDRATASGRSVDSSTYGQLQRDSTARAQGTQRTQDFSSYRHGGGGRAGSYRPRGGGRRR